MVRTAIQLSSPSNIENYLLQQTYRSHTYLLMKQGTIRPKDSFSFFALGQRKLMCSFPLYACLLSVCDMLAGHSWMNLYSLDASTFLYIYECSSTEEVKHFSIVGFNFKKSTFFRLSDLMPGRGDRYERSITKGG